MLTEADEYIEEIRKFAEKAEIDYSFITIAQIDIASNREVYEKLGLESQISLNFYVKGHPIQVDVWDASKHLGLWIKSLLNRKIKQIESQTDLDFQMHIAKSRKLVICYGLANLYSRKINFNKEFFLVALVLEHRIPFVQVEDEKFINKFGFHSISKSDKHPQIAFYSEGVRSEFNGETFNFENIVEFIEEEEKKGVNILNEKSFETNFDKSEYKGALIFLQKDKLALNLIDPLNRAFIQEVKSQVQDLSLSFSYNELGALVAFELLRVFGIDLDSFDRDIVLLALFSPNVAVKKYYYDGEMEINYLVEFIRGASNGTVPRLLRNEYLSDSLISGPTNLYKVNRLDFPERFSRDSKHFLLLHSSEEDNDLNFQRKFREACSELENINNHPICSQCNIAENDIDEFIDPKSIPALYQKDENSEIWVLLISKDFNNEYIFGSSDLIEFLSKNGITERKSDRQERGGEDEGIKSKSKIEL